MIDKTDPVVAEYLKARASLAGSVKSERKARAARRNGKKGGAPKGNRNAARKEPA